MGTEQDFHFFLINSLSASWYFANSIFETVGGAAKCKMLFIPLEGAEKRLLLMAAKNQKILGPGVPAESKRVLFCPQTR